MTAQRWAAWWSSQGAVVVAGWTPAECRAGRCTARGVCGAPGKHPLARWRDRDRTDLAEWDDHPDANVLLLTGARSGIDAIDVDPKSGGSWAALRAAFPELPEHPTVRTGSGGCHLYVRHPGHTTSNGLATHLRVDGVEGVDYRGDGGLVVAPPSLHASGLRYELVGPYGLAPYPDVLAAAARVAEQAREQRTRRAAALARRLAAHPPTLPANGQGTAAGLRLLDALLDNIAASAATAGQQRLGRHDTTYRQAYAAGGLVASGHLDHGWALARLTEVAVAVRPEGGQEKTVADGLADGRAHPWQPRHLDARGVAS